MTAASNRQIVLIHGRGSKPNKAALQDLWMEALTAGLKRDMPHKLKAFEAATVNMIYYADQFGDFIEPGFNETLDLDNRRQALNELLTRARAKDFRRKYYEELPGKTPLKEFAMDLSASFGMGGPAIRKTMPELSHYWQDNSGWASQLQSDVASNLRELLTQNQDVLIISHCMGSVVAWDGLWHLTQNAKIENSEIRRVTSWITLGSPLAARAVQNKLCGAAHEHLDRFPSVLNTWHNIAAEDDYVCHDKTVSDDFKEMLDQRLIGDIRDHTIYNLAVRYGRSNPHSSVGYLVHPRTVKLVADWLD